MLKIQTERPHLNFDGVRYNVFPAQAALVDTLHKANGAPVHIVRLMQAANCANRSVKVLMHGIREILTDNGYSLSCTPDPEGCTYTMRKDKQ